MLNQIMTTLTEDDLRQIVEQAIDNHEKKKTASEDLNKSYSIAKVAKMLGRSHTTIKNLVLSGKLNTTTDGRRILNASLKAYLKQET